MSELAASGLAAPPPSAGLMLGDRLDAVSAYGRVLATQGVTLGLIGPREPDRLWERHLLNCAALAELVPPAARVVDVGSGAGLPGLVLAAARVDLELDLVDSMQRRTAFLTETARVLGVQSRVRVHTGRAEDAAVVRAVGSAQFVTARAVAPLDRLARWCLPLLTGGGRLLAMKGASAAQEVDEHRRVLDELGAASVEVTVCGTDYLDEGVRVVVVTKA